MPSQSHRDDLPAHYRVQFLRRMAAAIIHNAERRRETTPRRPSIRATASIERGGRAATDDANGARRPERRALPRLPHRTNDETELSAERLREQLRQTDF